MREDVLLGWQAAENGFDAVVPGLLARRCLVGLLLDWHAIDRQLKHAIERSCSERASGQLTEIPEGSSLGAG